MTANDSGSRVRMLTAGFTILTSFIALLSESAYRGIVESYLKLMFVEEYSYLLVVLASTLTLFYYLFRSVGLSYEVRVSKVIVSVLLADLSLIFYISSFLDLGNAVQYGSLSLVLLVLALIIFIYNPLTLKDLIPLLSLFMLVPLPTSVIDSVTPHLSRFVGRAVAVLTGVTFIENPVYAQIVVVTPSGPAVFNVEIACTGIVSLSSVFAVIPVVTYLVAFSPSTARRKIVSVATSLMLAVLIGFLGNLVRVLLVIWGSMSYGVEVGMELFHSPLSIVYSTLSVLAAFFVADRYAGLRRLTPRSVGSWSRIEWGFVAGVLAVTLIFTSVYAVTLHYIASPNINDALRRDGIVLGDNELSDFMNNPPRYVFSGRGDLTLTHQSYSSYLTRVLGAFSVYEVVLVKDGVPHFGYVEVADTPGRFHTWQLCLRLQGYRVVNSWSRIFNGTRLYFIEVERDSIEGLLGYVIMPVFIGDSNAQAIAYVRASLMMFSPNLDVGRVEGNLSKALVLGSPGRTPNLSQSYTAMLYWATLASYILTMILVVYLTVTWSPHLINSLKNLFGFLKGK
ncbi:MAG: archaeosortase/exosortase family protein [Zestosphaera sp.]